MSYKIALASSDETSIDLSFREASGFLIAEVLDDGSFKIREKRIAPTDEHAAPKAAEQTAGGPGCGSGRGCGNGSGGCGVNAPKVLLVEDCRALVCTKAGFQIHKQLEKKAISIFEVEGALNEILEKIIGYYNRVDHHQSLRNFAKT